MNKLLVVGFLLIPFYYVFQSGDFDSKKPDPRSSLSTQQSLKDGEAVFKKYCISCHQADGAGVPHMAPPLIKTTYVLGDKEDMIKIVLNGLKGVEINDQTYNNPMPPLGTVLKDKEIADVLTYVRKSFGNKASTVSAADVKKVRAEQTPSS